MRAVAFLGVLCCASLAHAGKATLVGLAPAASDARKAVAIGPAGEVYEPDGNGAWVRTQAGGTAVELVGANAVGGTVIAQAKSAPPFKLTRGGWSAIYLKPRAKAVIGSGTRVLAAVGKSVFALDRGQPVKLADAPTNVRAVAGSSSGALIDTTKGLHKLVGSVWKPIKKAPTNVRGLVNDRWVIVDNGAFDVKTMKTIAWPAGVHVAEATMAGTKLVAVGTHGKQVELVTVNGKKVEQETVPLDTKSPIVGLVADREGRVVVATRDGTIAMRVGGTWTTSDVRVELGEPRPGPAPATCGVAAAP